jgi:hypothetical protein
LSHPQRSQARLLATIALAPSLAAAIEARLAPRASAVDPVVSTDAPDLTAVRARSQAKDWSGARRELSKSIDDGIQQAASADTHTVRPWLAA